MKEGRLKRAELLHEVIIHIILIGLILAVFLMATADKVNARGVKQQVLEKQTALLIDSAVPGMSYEIAKNNLDGTVQSVEIKDGKIFIGVDGLSSLKGYPFFSPYSVAVEESSDKFVVRINE